MTTRVPILSVPVLVVISVACSSGPRPPQPGSPAFYWNAANTTYKAGDFVKAKENLLRLAGGESEYAAKARPWSVVLAAGLTDGYAQMADAYENGARANRNNPTPFRRQVTAMRTLAGQSALEFVEGVHQFMTAGKEANVIMAFEMPTGVVAEPANLKKISSGMVLQDSEQELLLKAMLQRGVAQAACDFTGSADPPQALEKLKSGAAEIPRATFLLAAAKALHERSGLFDSRRLDQPNRLIMLCDQAMEAIKEVPESKDTKALDAKIQASLKKVKKG